MQKTQTAWERWAHVEARGSSPTYERLALAFARDPAAMRILAGLPGRARQPNPVFAALRWFDVDVTRPDEVLVWVAEHWPLLVDVVSRRRTQTNEPARCATLLPALAMLPGPLAIIEVGASAGLCLLYDSWRYRYVGSGVDHTIGDPLSPVLLTCRVEGPVPLPDGVPTIAYRVGLDLHPMDAADPDARRWLGCLVWPEHTGRAQRLALALDVAAQRRPKIHAGDLLDKLPALLDRLPSGLIPVVVHSATLAYVDAEQRKAFVELLDNRGVIRLGAEGVNVLPELKSQIPQRVSTEGAFVISMGENVLALAHHGSELRWLADGWCG